MAATANFNIQPQDGWVAITAAGVDFIKVRQYPRSQPFYITSNATPPASTVRGYLVDCEEEFLVNVPIATNFYVRAVNAKPDLALRIDVFYELT